MLHWPNEPVCKNPSVREIKLRSQSAAKSWRRTRVLGRLSIIPGPKTPIDKRGQQERLQRTEACVLDFHGIRGGAGDESSGKLYRARRAVRNTGRQLSYCPPEPRVKRSKFNSKSSTIRTPDQAALDLKNQGLAKSRRWGVRKGKARVALEVERGRFDAVLRTTRMRGTETPSESSTQVAEMPSPMRAPVALGRIDEWQVRTANLPFPRGGPGVIQPSPASLAGRDRRVIDSRLRNLRCQSCGGPVEGHNDSHQVVAGYIDPRGSSSRVREESGNAPDCHFPITKPNGKLTVCRLVRDHEGPHSATLPKGRR